ncbi:unnamed protein product [Auanema sp. JU1783]|nr:unnamed protein product [Auanema sp. JU1783]
MKVLFAILLCLVISSTKCTISKEHQKAIENILEHAGDKTVSAIFNEIEQVVSSMGSGAQADHEKWKNEVRAENKKRELAMKEAIDDLSPEARGRLVRIIMVQQNAIMTQNEKRELLRKIKYDMDEKVKQELLSKIPEKTLFNTIL